MYLITEQSFDTKVVTESKGDKKSYFIEGIFMQAEQQNRNGRIYKKEVLKPAVDRYIEEQVKTDRAVGELNHPVSSPSVNYKEVSHKIESLEWDGNDIIGRAKIVSTPNGEIVKGLLEDGVQIGVSSRGLGSIVTEEGTDYVADDFILSTIDIVHDPSAPNAFVNGIMEGVQWVMTEEGIFKPIKESEATPEVKALNETEEYIAFRKFINKLVQPKGLN